MLIEARNRAGWWCREFGGEDRQRVEGGARGRFAAKVGVDGSGLGEVPGVEAEPMRCLAGAPVRRSGGITAAQWFGSGTEGAGVALGCRGGGGVARVGLQGVATLIKGGAGISWASVPLSAGEMLGGDLGRDR